MLSQSSWTDMKKKYIGLCNHLVEIVSHSELFLGGYTLTLVPLQLLTVLITILELFCTSLKCHPLSAIFIFWERKKSQEARSGDNERWGITAMLFQARK